ncbi:MAG: hypothetical protein Q8R28_08025 [Dehalococcoidia bacterium]|nr:hypothetical protein [Dehalococcoidia bacterium]
MAIHAIRVWDSDRDVNIMLEFERPRPSVKVAIEHFQSLINNPDGLSLPSGNILSVSSPGAWAVEVRESEAGIWRSTGSYRF